MSFSDILWSYAHLLLSFCHIQFGSECSSCYIMMYCVLIWEGCYILPCISFCCRRSNMVLNVPFFFGIHSIGVACFAAAGTHHPAVVYRSIFQASSEQNASGHLGNLCLSCFDSSIKGISCDTSRNGGNCSNYRVEIGAIKNLEDLANRNSSVTVRTLIY